MRLHRNEPGWLHREARRRSVLADDARTSPTCHRRGDEPRPRLGIVLPDRRHPRHGRTTYETVLGFGEWPFEGKRVIVLSSTLDTSDRADIARSVDEVGALLTESDAERVYVDGGQTIRAFISRGLIDELTVSIAPILLGRGTRLFGELDRDVLLTLRGHHSTASDGLVRITYDVTTP